MRTSFKFTFAIAISMLASSFSFAQETDADNQSPFAGMPDEFEVRTFTAIPKNNKVFVNWTVVDTSGKCAYIVQRSVDGKNYDNICMKKGAPSPGSSPILFSFVDEKPITGNTYYRLKRIAESGVIATRAIEVHNNEDAGSTNIALK